MAASPTIWTIGYERASSEASAGGTEGGVRPGADGCPRTFLCHGAPAFQKHFASIAGSGRDRVCPPERPRHTKEGRLAARTVTASVLEHRGRAHGHAGSRVRSSTRRGNRRREAQRPALLRGRSPCLPPPAGVRRLGGALQFPDRAYPPYDGDLSLQRPGHVPQALARHFHMPQKNPVRSECGSTPSSVIDWPHAGSPDRPLSSAPPSDPPTSPTHPALCDPGRSGSP